MNNKKIKKTEHLVVRITTSQLKSLTSYLESEDMSKSELIRRALRQYITPNNKSTNI